MTTLRIRLFAAAAALLCAAARASLPAPLEAALAAAKLAPEDVTLEVTPADSAKPLASLNAQVPKIPASVIKVATAAAALDRLGAGYRWETQILADAAPEGGVLTGNLYMKGSGDPELTVERFWLMLDMLRARGIREIRGDIVVDRTKFELGHHDQFAFDGDGNRPYNLGADAFLLAARSLGIRFVPEGGKALLLQEPVVGGVSLQESVPVAPGACVGWRAALKPDYSQPLRPRFHGAYPSECGERTLYYTTLPANAFVKAVFTEGWEQKHGVWKGIVRDGKTPEGAVLLARSSSGTLPAVIRSMNKFSNNLMARQVFLEIGQGAAGEPKSLARSREAVREWAAGLGIRPGDLEADNGSGLSRSARLSAAAGNAVLRHMWASPLMPEFVSSLPISGVDGTMAKRRAAEGRAHVKTGFLSSARSICGYVRADSGKTYAVTVIVNGARAAASSAFMDAVLDWVCSSAP